MKIKINNDHLTIGNTLTFKGKTEIVTSDGNITLDGTFTVVHDDEQLNGKIFVDILYELVKNNSKINAIRLYRNKFNCSLYDAKVYIEDIIKLLESVN
jgi:ribosomal protein L7/L12